MRPDLHDLPSEITTGRLHLRRYRPADSALYFQMLRGNAEHLREFMPSFLADALSEEEITTWFDKQNAEWQALNLFIFSAWDKATGAYVGESYLANPDWDVPRLEVGYFLVKDAVGKGYAAEAANAVIRFAFEKLNVLRVDLQCVADNAASMKVATRCGFTQEGRFRQHHRKKDGTLVDTLWFGLLLSEWQQLQNR